MKHFFGIASGAQTINMTLQNWQPDPGMSLCSPVSHPYNCGLALNVKTDHHKCHSYEH